LPFLYHRPSSLQQAMQLLAEPGSVAKMGGCDVLTRYRRGELNARSVVALNDLPGVAELSVSPAGVHIGAAVTLAQLARDADVQRRWPVIAGVVGKIASPAIRGSASVVGNIAQGWSVSDVVPLFAACGAELRVLGPSGERRVAGVEYASQPRNAVLKPGELITAAELPAAGPDFRLSYERFSFREAFDLPLVSVAVGASIRGGVFTDVRIAVVGGSSMPARCAQAEAALSGRSNDEGAADKAAAAVADWATPVSDFRASADYRRELVKVMLRRALAKLRLQ
jgi:CO/xanthine dehydrogenase FAD-binding subunit